jgi:hypothetical protein
MAQLISGQSKMPDGFDFPSLFPKLEKARCRGFNRCYGCRVISWVKSPRVVTINRLRFDI